MIHSAVSTQTTGELGDLAGAALYSDFCKASGVELDELARIDALTPFYRSRINQLSPKKRKILTALVREGEPLRIKDLAGSARIDKHGIVSVQVGRLVEDGLVQRLPDGRYSISDDDPDLVKYLNARLTEFSTIWTSQRSKELIPDRETPITYFMRHRTEIIGRMYRH
ncbi:hypothetical protein CMO93_04205 [Candidatus Woesearchaeota archaeon]|nr:hypothetical protein [Candidatus Woesearchaeota archaeon]|tara:strand:+ start:47 stop:550 length:504 start_codon:yes stop_codon:yes gene_type:complete